MSPISDADMERFHRNAPAALARRGGSHNIDEFGRGVSTMLTGLVPIAGLLFWNWSASQLILFLLVGAWIAIVCDFVKLRLLREQIMKTAEAYYDDWHVWVIVKAKRNGADKAPRDHLRASYKPNAGVIVDLTFGVLSTVVIWISMTHASGKFGLAQLGDGGLLYGLIGLAAYRVLFTAWEIVVCKSAAGANRGVKVAVGLRGVGLFLLMFLVLMLGGGDDAAADAERSEAFARNAMFVVNGVIVLFGLLTACGPLSVRGETAWLRRRLAERNAGGRPPGGDV